LTHNSRIGQWRDAIVRIFSGASRPKANAATDSIWHNNIDSELRHWESWLGDPAFENLRRQRLEFSKAISADLVRLARVPPGATIRVIDVGSGPISTVGRTSPTNPVELTCTDALADQYNRLLDRFGFASLPRIAPVKGETLADVFGENRFNIVHCSNALDHFENPALSLQHMYRICKPGGVVVILSIEDEGEREKYSGLHQWNLHADDHGFWLWNRTSRRNLLAELPRAAEFEWRYVDHGAVGFRVFRACIRKAASDQTRAGSVS
jgi:SAM-dependent methyltransferase